MTIFIHQYLSVLRHILNTFHFMKFTVTPEPKVHTTVLATHYIFIYSVFIFSRQLSSQHRLILLNWFKWSSRMWWIPVSIRYHNAPPTGSKVFSFKRVDFSLYLVFLFLWFLLMSPLTILLHHISLSCCCYNCLPHLSYFSESNPMLCIF